MRSDKFYHLSTKARWVTRVHKLTWESVGKCVDKETRNEMKRSLRLIVIRQDSREYKTKQYPLNIHYGLVLILLGKNKFSNFTSQCQ